MDKSNNGKVSNFKSGNILYNFFHQIKKDMGLEENKFMDLIKDHYKHKSKFKQIGHVNNLKSALISNNYSFKTFLRALGALDVRKIKITLELTKMRGEVTIHTYTADLKNVDSDTDEED